MHVQLNCVDATSWQGKRIHMVGIGGCGMLGAATILADLGAKVSGTDRQAFEGITELTARGIVVTIGHGAEYVAPGVELLVRTAAVSPNHPEVEEAVRRGIPVLKYAQWIGQLMQGRIGVAIAGTHGKTTTTAMTAHIFRHAGMSPTFVVGGKSNQLEGSAALGAGLHFIVEPCEYDRSFLEFYPRIAAILNVEKDHFDCYPDMESLWDAFTQFARQVHPQGIVICRANDQRVLEAARRTTGQVETFGLGPGADWQAVGLICVRGRYSFTIMHHGRAVLDTRLGVLGEHNVANALAAAAVSVSAGLDPSAVSEALATFEGVQRRMTLKGSPRGVTIVDDYAHHPTEIRVTIDAVKRSCDPRKTWVIFQPHQYCRTKHLLDEFAESFDQADEVIVPDVYEAREEGAISREVNSTHLVARMRDRGVNVRHIARLNEVGAQVEPQLSEGDLVLTLGAGDVWKVADDLVARMG